ncbi:hypothetical protein B0J15DRAFT_113798 [Fusarium solani]|uniref:Uncharacterized protein n=1 Tax=Fusarium solani TaxID=169388 RepID=A0A9P9L4R1_FUSSL|nr:uncharacterized protein B0J15DRAFT_113798 [Fusarium solani]KAH7273905.1 hypothetical protein B0J15DRAFT_113798 [Fusarium solani]
MALNKIKNLPSHILYSFPSSGWQYSLLPSSEPACYSRSSRSFVSIVRFVHSQRLRRHCVWFRLRHRTKEVLALFLFLIPLLCFSFSPHLPPLRPTHIVHSHLPLLARCRRHHAVQDLLLLFLSLNHRLSHRRRQVGYDATYHLLHYILVVDTPY